jgi:cation:H+ antiporter
MGLQIMLGLMGFVLLYYGADWLVKGSSSLARSLGVTPLVIGLTVVAFGTSTPELVVSVVSAVKSKSMIAVGNVVGSNICNIALILGIAALLHPIHSHPAVVRRDIPIMVGVSVYLLVLLSVDSNLGRLEGLSLVVGVVAYTFLNYYWARKSNGPSPALRAVALAGEVEQIGYVPSRPRQLLMIVGGVAGVVIGAELVVDAAVVVMTALGVGEKFIGLTIVAFGTSLPELATSVVAALRNEMDISIGNLVGSNVFNLLSVLGLAALVRPIHIPGGFFGSGLWLDVLVMIAISALPYFMMRRDFTLSRRQAGILLGCYGVYLAHLIIRA